MAVSITNEQMSIIKADPCANLKVIAVPGSGKSTALIYRIGYLLSKNIRPERMLVIMFNDSAVSNFVDDMSQLQYMNLPDVRTYHSFARRLSFILIKKSLLQKTTFTPNQVHYKNFYRTALKTYTPEHLHKQLNVDSSDTINSFIRLVELCKSSLLPPEVVFKKFKFSPEKLSFINSFYKSEEKRHAEKIQFFSDLIYDIVMLCKRDPSVIARISNKHDVILVDEYQDANQACHELVKIICGSRGRVNLVGDDDQTIYDFTGAEPRFLKDEANNDFHNISEFYLTKTFRYGHTIALIANNIISNNDCRIEKFCVSGRPDLHSTISIASYTSLHLDTEQSDLIKEISDYVLTNQGQYRDICILMRNYSSSFSLELALLRHGIPYYINGESKTALHSEDSKFIRSALVALSDTASNIERVTALEYFLKSYFWIDVELKFFDVCNSLINDDINGALDALTLFQTRLKPDVVGNIARRAKTFCKVMRSRKTDVAYRLNRLIDDSGIKGVLAKKYWRSTIDPVKRFDALLAFYSSLSDNPQQSVLIVDNIINDVNLADDKNALQFCSLHKSKGLAWPYVIIAHCEEGICPSIESANDEYLVEVERRLFYVGVTRGRKKLTFHIPIDHNLIKSLKEYRGYMNDVDYFNKGYASRFIYEGNIISATQIGTEIYRGDNRSIITSTGNRHNYNRYLNELGLEYRISGLQEYT